VRERKKQVHPHQKRPRRIPALGGVGQKPRAQKRYLESVGAQRFGHALAPPVALIRADDDGWADLPEYLESLNLFSGSQLTNSAIVLFGVNPARVHPQTRMRVAVYNSDDPRDFADNQVFEGNLFTLFEFGTSYIQRNVGVESRFVDLVRHDEARIPRVVVREALINALVHRDYERTDANLTIAIYVDRLEIWNPGGLPEGLNAEELPTLRVSRPRNPDIANVAFVRGLIEQWGSGTHQMLVHCRRAGLRDPVWREVGGGVRVTVHYERSRTGLSVEAIPDRARGFAAQSFPGQAITLREYNERYAPGLSESTARRDLNLLVQHGLLQKAVGELPSAYVRTDVSIVQ